MSKTLVIEQHEYQLPFVNDEAGYIWSNDGQMAAQVRNWGRLSNIYSDLKAIQIQDAFAKYVAAALNDYHPWKYPSRGELPDNDGWYLVTTDTGHVEQAYWDSIGLSRGTWRGKSWEEEKVRAWRELPESASAIEE